MSECGCGFINDGGRVLCQCWNVDGDEWVWVFSSRGLSLASFTGLPFPPWCLCGGNPVAGVPPTGRCVGALHPPACVESPRGIQMLMFAFLVHLRSSDCTEQVVLMQESGCEADSRSGGKGELSQIMVEIQRKPAQRDPVSMSSCS